jgi:hypothetical protein
VLKLDGPSDSPTIPHRILHRAGVVSSFDVAAVALSVVGEMVVSDRQINKLTTEVGQQLEQDRDERTARHVISEDERLAAWLRNRPISPFSPRCRASTLATSV